MNTFEKTRMHVCLIVMTHKILYGKEYFSSLIMYKVNVHAISGPVKIIDDFGNVTIIFKMVLLFHIELSIVKQ